MKKTAPFVPPFPRSYEVLPDLYAGEWPGGDTQDLTLEKLRALLDCGVDRIISLTEEREIGTGVGQKPPYDETLARLAAATGRRVIVSPHPIPDYSLPEAAAMRAIIGETKSALAAGETIYIHCWGGRGRTGTVVACLLRELRGLAGDEALTELARLREGTPDAAAPSPETEEQREFVRNWENVTG